MSFKRFEEMEPATIELVTTDGKAKRYTAKPLTSGVLEKFSEIAAEKPDPKKSTRICRQMELIFGGVPEDYKNYDIRMLKQVLRYVQEEPENPTQPQAELLPDSTLQN